MANETPNSGPITLINVFELRPDDIEQFLQHWRERAEFLGRQVGFRSLRLHRALNPGSPFQFPVAAYPAVYRVVIEATAE